MAVTTPAWAQAPPTFSVRDALVEARRSNPELIALQRQSDAARAAVPASRFLDAPTAEVQIWGWPITTVNPARTDMYMFTGEQALPGKGKRAARERVAVEDAQVSETQIAVRANVIYAEIRQAYAELFLARATAELFERQTPLLEATTDLASIRYAAGQSGQHDTVRSLVELSRLGVDRIEWRERARLAETQLNALMGRAPDESIPALVASDTSVASEGEPQRFTVASNADVVMASAAIAREEAELARLRGERRPDYVVGGGYMLQPGEAGAWTARAGITWPNAPWSRGRLNTEIAAQEKRVEAARAQRAAIELGVRKGVRQATVRLEAARDRVRLLETTVLPRINQAVDVATVAYRSNRGDYTDLLDSQRMLLTTRMELVAAQADVQRALADLALATGVIGEN
jgi:outer membrane protein TolC